MEAKHYRHVIWDWNGTLLDDLVLSIEVMNTLLRRSGLPLLTIERYHQVFDFPVRSYYERLGFQEATDPFAKLSVDFINGYDERRWDCPLQRDVAAVLAAVRRCGMTQSILSAYRQTTLEEIVTHFGLRSHFLGLAGLSDIYAHSKLELGRAWVAKLGYPTPEIVLIGDTLHDLDVAEALEIDCVLVTHGHHPAERLRGRCSRVVPDLVSVLAELGVPLIDRLAAVVPADAGRESPAR